jgi:4-alpha-glucanotransferase
MRYTKGKRRVCGAAVPLSALRGPGGAGIGEYPDLKAFGEFCRDCGMELIQILPVNDSGSHASPYFALSAFALHPVYARLEDFPEAALAMQAARAAMDAAEAECLRGRADSAAPFDPERVDYALQLARKRAGLRVLHDASRMTRTSPELAAWTAANPWAKPYAVFKAIKERFGDRGWREWPEARNPDSGLIDALWSDPGLAGDLDFHCWTQLRLESQLASAAQALEGMGIQLKGDLPILLNEDSADVWARRGLFRTDLRAGSPPDAQSPLGQNWGFPIYDPEAMAAQGYGFWKERIAQADKFYHAFRLDHVLGFFRIWAVPEGDSSAALGRFLPDAGIDPALLAAEGFGPARLRWLSEPHIPGSALREAQGGECPGPAGRLLDRIGDEDLYLFKEGLGGEKDIFESGLPAASVNFLLAEWRQRSFIHRNDGTYAPAWLHDQARSWRSLSDPETETLETLARAYLRDSEGIWEKVGREALQAIRSASGMLTCAEDLGAIPACVPRVLGELGIMGLRVCRWTRDWESPGSPFIDLRDYPEDSVCALSVHDTSSLRGWWEESPDALEFYRFLGGRDDPPPRMPAALAAFMLRRASSCSSRLFVTSIQDYLALDPSRQDLDPRRERVNIPGVDDPTNWGYRMPSAPEELLANRLLVEAVRQVAARPPPDAA